MIYNPDMERAALGALLIDPDMFYRINGLTPDDFGNDAHKQVFEVLKDLVAENRETDLITVSEELIRRGYMEELGGPHFLSKLIIDTPNTINAPEYARRVQELAALRRFVRIMAEGTKLAHSQTDAAEVYSRTIQQLFDAAESLYHDNGGGHVKGAVNNVLDRIEAIKAGGYCLGVPTGLSDLDKLLGGLQRKDLVIIAGRPAMGKTSLALQIASKVPSAIFSLEMSSDQLAQRLISAQSGIDQGRLRTADLKETEWSELLSAANEVASKPLYVDDTPAISMAELSSKARLFVHRDNVRLIIVDYIQLMTGPKAESREKEISYISRHMKALARDLDVPVVVLSQLSRAVESRSDKRPILSDLRESGAIEQDADVVLFIYRDEYYYPDSTEMPGVAEILVRKHRNGPTGNALAFADLKHSRFKDLAMQTTDLKPY